MGHSDGGVEVAPRPGGEAGLRRQAPARQHAPRGLDLSSSLSLSLSSRAGSDSGSSPGLRRNGRSAPQEWGGWCCLCSFCSLSVSPCPPFALRAAAQPLIDRPSFQRTLREVEDMSQMHLVKVRASRVPSRLVGLMGLSARGGVPLQGYHTHKKHPPAKTLP